MLWVSVLFSSYSYPYHWPLIPPSELSHIKLDHLPPALLKADIESRSAHDQPLLLKTACVFLLTTAQQSPYNPAFLWLVSTVFSTLPLLLHQMVNSNWRVSDPTHCKTVRKKKAKNKLLVRFCLRSYCEQCVPCTVLISVFVHSSRNSTQGICYAGQVFNYRTSFLAYFPLAILRQVFLLIA